MTKTFEGRGSSDERMLLMVILLAGWTASSLIRPRDPTKALYDQHVSYLEGCGHSHQPEAIEVGLASAMKSMTMRTKHIACMQDLSPLLKTALGIEDACVFNPGLVLLSEEQGTILLAFRVYWSKLVGIPCISSKVMRLTITRLNPASVIDHMHRADARRALVR